MPLPTDEQTVKTAGELAHTMKAIFSTPDGYRPAHAKGILLSGVFTPTPLASTLSSAPHFLAPSTPILGRFSSSTGIPVIPDLDPNGDPRGFGIRFLLPDQGGKRRHTDVIAHSTPFFPTRTGEEFLEFLHALIATSKAGDVHPSPVEMFLGGHPSALAFVQAPKPTPKSFATQAYWAVNAFIATNAEGKSQAFRYQIVPDAGVQVFEQGGEELKAKGPDFLHEELHARLATGPISFKLLAQLAAPEDPTNDATIHWPSSRPVLELGTLALTTVVENAGHGAPEVEQKKLILDPVPRIEGLESSEDPLLEMRAGIYLISGRERRAAV